MDPKLTRKGRELCWAARDQFFACAESSDPSACTEQRKEFEDKCIASWVTYFDELFEQKIARAKLLAEASK
jgi:hypothetical protein